MYTLLEQHNAPICHQLHYLQMASEKVAKAYRFRDTSTSPEKLLCEHVGFTKFFKVFLLSDRVKQMYQGKASQLREIARSCCQLEKLAPAVDKAKRPANPEYPWQHGAVVLVPRDHEFPNLSLLTVDRGRTFLKLLKIAIKEFSTIAI
jgi:hypothetical protein